MASAWLLATLCLPVPPWWRTPLAFLASLTLGIGAGLALRSHFAVLVTPTAIEGPNRIVGRVSIARSELDLRASRTGHRGLRAIGSHVVCSHSGAQIIIIRSYFEPQTLRALLDAVDLAP